MARFETTTIVRRSPHETLRALRDGLSEIVTLLDDVTRIETIDRQAQLDGSVRVVNIWHAGGNVPPMIARVLGANTLAWTDRAEWHADGTGCHFRIEPHFMKDSIRCEGQTQLEDAVNGRSTRLRFTGEFNLERMPGMARMLGGGIGETVERFVADAIAQNLGKLGRALSSAARPGNL
jgi:hypothetical protein